jgi:hypothetical protein
MIANKYKEFPWQGHAPLGLRQPAAAFVQAACCQTAGIALSSFTTVLHSRLQQYKERYGESRSKAVTIVDTDSTLPTNCVAVQNLSP